MSETETTTTKPKAAARGPGKPRNRDYASMIDTKEGQRAVEQAAFKMLDNPATLEAIVERLAGQLGQARAAAGSEAQIIATPNEEGSLLRKLAMAIAEVGGANSRKMIISPEEVEKRRAAHDRMIKLILDAHARGQQPEYALVAKVYLNERLIDPFFNGTDKSIQRRVIGWTGIPNEAMRPVGDLATSIFSAFLESLGGATALSVKVAGDNRPVSITPNGLTIRGAVGHKRTLGGLEASIPEPYVPGMAPSEGATPFPESLALKGPFDPTAQNVHVLGTIMTPARQNAIPGVAAQQ